MNAEFAKLVAERHTFPTPRGRDVRKMEKPYSGREVVFTCSNGWTLEILTHDDQSIEGFFMGHCLGGKDSGACEWGEYLSLREPDGTPHVTIDISGGIFHPYGRCNAYPKAAYVELLNEYRESEGKYPLDLEEYTSWGTDTDETYHEKGHLDDRDYRDSDAGRPWRDLAWRLKCGIS